MNPPPPDSHAAACRIREAEARDLETIVEFNCALALESEGFILDPAVVMPGARAILEDPHRGRYFMAEVHGRLIGQTQITYEWSDWRNAWFWWLQSVYVHPDHRRRGVFASLYAHILDLAKRSGDVCGLRLYVAQDNDPAIATYARLMQRAGYLFYETTWSEAVRKANADSLAE